MTEDSYIRVCKAMAKCLLLESIEFSFPKIVSELLTGNVNLALEKMNRRLIFVKQRLMFASLHPSAVKNYINHQFQLHRARSKTKSLAIRYMLNKGWTMAESPGNLKIDKFMKNIEPHPLLENLKFQMIRVDLNSEEIMKLMNAVKTKIHLKHFCLELLNCGLGELEIVSFLYKISTLTQLESLTFKFIENTTTLSEPIAFAFVETFSRMPNLHTFNIYFRKLNISPCETQLLENKLSEIPNIHYINHKGSIEITRSPEIRKNSISSLHNFNKLYI